jgi:CRP-like cAMP-binding protein
MSRDVLSGDLEFLELGELLQLLGMTGQSGIIYMKSPWSDAQGRIDILDGTPVDASDGEKDGLDALFALFGWKEGHFRVSKQPVITEDRIQKNRMNIIMDAMRMLDEGLIKQLNPTSESDPSDSSPESKKSRPVKLPLVRGEAPDYSDIVDEERYEDGQSIIREGKFGRWVYVVLDGKAEVVKETSQGPVKLLRLGPGTFPGTVLFFSNYNARATSLVAAGKVHLGVLNQERLYSEISGKTQAIQALASGIAKRLKRMTDSAVLYSQKLPPTHIDLHALKQVALAAKDKNALHVVRSGRGALVAKQGDHLIPLTKLEAGDVIGELSFLDSVPKLPGVRVYGTEDLKLLKLDTDKLSNEYDQFSPTLRAMVKNLAVRVTVSGWLACRYYLKMPVKAKGKK